MSPIHKINVETGWTNEHVASLQRSEMKRFHKISARLQHSALRFWSWQGCRRMDFPLPMPHLEKTSGTWGVHRAHEQIVVTVQKCHCLLRKVIKLRGCDKFSYTSPISSDFLKSKPTGWPGNPSKSSPSLFWRSHHKAWNITNKIHVTCRFLVKKIPDEFQILFKITAIATVII